ncbi:hypothetical protein D3C87_1992520 [compost metagenome]
MDRRQPQVAGPGRDPARRLQFVEEGEDQRCIDVIQGERRGRLAQPPLHEPQQQTEGIAVRSDRVRAGLALLHQPLREEALQQPGE